MQFSIASSPSKSFAPHQLQVPVRDLAPITPQPALGLHRVRPDPLTLAPDPSPPLMSRRHPAMALHITPQGPLTANPAIQLVHLRRIQAHPDPWDLVTLPSRPVTLLVHTAHRDTHHQDHLMAPGRPTVLPMLSITPVLRTTRQDGPDILKVCIKKYRPDRIIRCAGQIYSPA